MGSGCGWWQAGLLAVCAVAVWGASTASADAPEQFRVWGRRAAPDPYIGEPDLAPAPVAQADPTPQETARGFVLFAREPSELVRPDHVPAAADRCLALEARDCAGEYGPVTFEVFALADGDFTVTVGDLSGPGGVIPAEDLDLRAVRYAKVTSPDGAQTVPLLLEAFERVHVAAGLTQQFWITYYVPPGRAPGTYEATVRIVKDALAPVELPLRLRVNPYALGGPGEDLRVYYSGSSDPADLPLVRKELIDQRCHGMTASDLPVPVSRDGDLDLPALQPLLDAYKAVGFPSGRAYVSLYNRITSEWLNTPDRSIRMWGPWFRYYPFSETLDERYVRTVQAIRQAARERGLQVVLAVADEAGSHAWTIEATRHYNELVRDRVPGVIRELSVGGGWAMGQPEEQLWHGLLDIWTTNRWLPDKLAAVRAGDPDAAIAIYNMAGPGSDAGGLQCVRLFYGFFSWKARAAGAAQWVYRDRSTPAHNYSWPAADPREGPVPTLHWEALREGAKDRRYLATLEAALEGRSGPGADAARRLLDEVAAQVELRNEDYDPIDGGRIPAHPPGTYERWRAQIEDATEALLRETPPVNP
jgi:hypothetical protein